MATVAKKRPNRLVMTPERLKAVTQAADRAAQRGTDRLLKEKDAK